MKRATPSFLMDAYDELENEAGIGSLDRLAPHMKNWLTAHAYIRTLQPNKHGIREVQDMMLYEIYWGHGRLHILQRLRGRFVALRNAYEERELYALELK